MLPLLEKEQGRTRDVHALLVHHRSHVAEEEGQKQCPDVRAVNVGIRHHDHLAITQLLQVEIFPYTRTQRHNQGLKLIVIQHLVNPGLLHIQRLAPQGQYRLKGPFTALRCRAAGRVPLHQVHLCLVPVLGGAVQQFARQASALQHALPAYQFARLPGGLPGASGFDGLLQDPLDGARALFEILSKLFAHDGLHNPPDLAVAELGLGLSLKLRFRNLHADHGGQAFACVFARQRELHIAKQVVPHGVRVHCPCKRRSESGLVGTALHRVHIVNKTIDVLGIGVVVLQCHFHAHVVAHRLKEYRLVDGVAAFVQVRYEGLKAPLEVELLLCARAVI